MGVHVDQPGHQDFAAAINGLAAGVIGNHVVLRSDGHDGIALNGDRSGGILVETLIDRENMSIGEQYVDVFHRTSSFPVL